MGWFADFRFANHNCILNSWTPRLDGLKLLETNDTTRTMRGQRIDTRSRLGSACVGRTGNA